MKNEAANELYTYSVSVGEKTYIITVATNWATAPKVYLPKHPQIMSVVISSDQLEKL